MVGEPNSGLAAFANEKGGSSMLPLFVRPQNSGLEKSGL